jgi:hypothetical protein
VYLFQERKSNEDQSDQLLMNRGVENGPKRLRNLVTVILTSSLVMSMPVVAAESAIAEDMHPIMTDKYWVNMGVFFAARDLDASIEGGLGIANASWDFESSMGLDDKPDLFMTEFGWQYGEDWGLSLQYFRSDRHANKTLEETIEWGDLIFNVGVDVSATSKIAITRLFFSRRFWDGGRHSVRLGAGIHLLEAAVTIGGEVTLDDMSTEYRTGAASASFPVPDVGVWYRYSPSDRWLLNARLDWFSADVGDFKGSVWNFAAGANLRITEHFGIGLSYQLFEIDGLVRETYWRGSIRTRLTGPNLHMTAHW